MCVYVGGGGGGGDAPVYIRINLSSILTSATVHLGIMSCSEPVLRMIATIQVPQFTAYVTTLYEVIKDHLLS